MGMDGRSHGDQEPTTVSCIHWKIWDRAPEPNLTVLYSSHLPEGLQEYAAAHLDRGPAPYSMRMMM